MPVAGAAPLRRDGREVGREAVHRETRSETGADLHAITKEDRLDLLVRDRGT